MQAHIPRGERRNSGLALVLGLIFVVLMASLALAFASSSVLEFRKSANTADAAQAQLAAESGLLYYRYILRDLQLPPGTTKESLLNGVESALTETFAAMPADARPTLARTGDALTVSAIPLARGGFAAELLVAGEASPLTCYLTVTGTKGQAARFVRLRAVCAPLRSPIFDYGVASRGKIIVSGSAVLEGVNEAAEACVLSTREEPVAIEGGGQASISGDLYVTGEDVDYVLLKGSVSIGGTSDRDEILADHLYLGTEDPEFPEIDTAPFAALATTIVDANTDLSGAGNVYNNIRIKAGTDPDFPNTTQINGIVYVEAPNKVTFHAQTEINGLIVTEDAGGLPIDDCQIDFRGSTSAPGVAALPDTPEFAAVKEHRGSMILAPGFGLTFRGNTNCINGLIAADQLSFRGTSDISGEISGMVLGLKDTELTLQGNSTIRINRAGDTELPAGFKHSMGLVFDQDSYTEPCAE